jgi:predicted transcriptional regulator
MGKTVSTRLDENDIKKLDKIADKEKVDRAALIRKFVLQKLEEY